MFSFVAENKHWLHDFFHTAVHHRKEALQREGVCIWLASGAQAKLIEQTAPQIIKATSVHTGIHATAHIFDRCVVKHNIFGEYPKDGQADWLRWCEKNQHNPLVPKIGMLVTDPDTDRFIAVMERLSPHAGFEDHTYRYEIDTHLQHWMATFGRSKKFFKELKEYKRAIHESIAELHLDLAMLRADGDEEITLVLEASVNEHIVALQYIEQLIGLYKTIRADNRKHFLPIRGMLHKAKQVGRIIDMHSLNWMMRSGQPVLLDPIN